MVTASLHTYPGTDPDGEGLAPIVSRANRSEELRPLSLLSLLLFFTFGDAGEGERRSRSRRDDLDFDDDEPSTSLAILGTTTVTAHRSE